VSDGRIEVASFDSGVEATAAASLLRASGVEVEFVPRDSGGVRAFAGMAVPGRLLVAPHDVERAREILAMAESGAYEEGLESIPEVEATPEEPDAPGDIESGLRSLGNLRSFATLTGFGAAGAALMAITTRKPVAALAVLVLGFTFYVSRFALHFARCPRCHLRFHGNWTWTKNWPNTCVNCGLKLRG
jgi:putative signal transducing protein